MAGFNPLNRGGLVLLPTRGATGATGASGLGEPFTAVDSLSATPRSVTDWGALLNAAIVSGTRRFVFGPYDYPFTTKILAKDVGGIHFEGTSMMPGGFQGSGNGARTRMIWKTGGSGYAIDISITTPTWNSNYFEHIEFTWDTATGWTGSYFDCNENFMTKFEHCDFGSGVVGVGTATYMIDAHNINTLIVSDCYFTSGYTCAVRSNPQSVGGFSNVLRFSDTTFGLPALENPGLDVLFDHCIFEMTSFPANKSSIYDTGTYAVDANPMVTMRDCCYWDEGVNAATVRVVNAQFNQWYFHAYSCFDHLTGGTVAALYDLKCNGSVVIHGGTINNTVNVGNAAVATQKKELIDITGVEMRSGVTTALVTNLNTGHIVVNFSANGGGPNLLGNASQQLTIAHERVLRVDQPSAAAHAGVTNHTFTRIGGDVAGVILISNTGGVTGPTGLLCDVTLANAPSSPGFGASVDNHREFPLVATFPFVPDDAGNFFGTPSASQTIACQPYAYAKSLFNSGSQGSFSIGVNVGIPAGATIGVGYRVLHL
jgi:hypothetical protein